MTPLNADACSARLGEPAGSGGLLMRDARAVRPKAILDAWLAGAASLTASVASIARSESGWRLSDAAGRTVAEAEVVVLAAGWGSKALAPDLPLSPVGGQAEWIEGLEACPVAWGGYAVPTGEGLLFGATHDRGHTGREPSEEASRRNRATLSARLPGLAARVEAADAPRSRAAVRATTPDRLPLAGALEEGLYVLGGLGSRGFCAAPLLAEHVAAIAVGVPSPLPADLATRVAPLRFSIAAGLVQPAEKADG
jgi:tRNA 5-methylaminomethyl-2-thiouridine biosynthesis bifunctional protein